MRFKTNLNYRLIALPYFCFTFLLGIFPAMAQEKAATKPPPAQLLKRSIIKREAGRFAYGGTITLVGAPQGSITIEGWSRAEIELTAETELQGETEEDLNRIALVNGFVFEEGANHVRILSVGTHDKRYMRRVAGSFPKKLLGLPWKIDYKLRVPEFVDLEINAGYGPISLNGVQGSLALTAADSVAQLTLSAGVVNATLGSGKLDLKIPVRSWRGTGAEIRLAAGEINVELPSGFNGDIDANILRIGKIVDSHGELQARQRNGIMPQMIRARAGAGGAIFKFTVADGTITFKKP